MSWSTPLAWPITPRSGVELRTLANAARVLGAMRPDQQKNEWVMCAIGLIVRASETEDDKDIAEATKQVELALTREGMLR